MKATVQPLLEIQDLAIRFTTSRGVAQALRGVELKVVAGEAVGLVGESGSGKSVTARAVMGLAVPPGQITRGDVLWRGRSLLQEGYARRIRGKEISVVPQDPMRSLNPLQRIGTQLTEVLRIHSSISRRQSMVRSIELLRQVGIADPERRSRQYPHQLSGGMCQRVLIAMALAPEPALLIADEPTTALDVTIQAEILDLLDRLRHRFNLALLLISHDLGVVVRSCDSVAIMYSGRILESGPTAKVFDMPAHPYTAGLLASIPPEPGARQKLRGLPGAPPDAIQPPPGCAFHPRCDRSLQHCIEEAPPLAEHADECKVACWNPLTETGPISPIQERPN